MTSLPDLRLLPGRHRRVAQGFPWIYSNELVMDAAARELEPGSLVRVLNASGEPEGLAFLNRHTLIAARLLTRSTRGRIDEAFLAERISRAVALRERLRDRPYYRLVHAEADGLPGTVVDRYGDCVVVQIGIAGMDRLKPQLAAALAEAAGARTVVFDDDASVRSLEGLPAGRSVALGTDPGVVAVEENGARYLADLGAGQKTGWFYDQAENRAWIRRFARGAKVLDAYCYTGGFALQAALGGAAEVVGIDRSEGALELARRAAEENGVASRCSFVRAEVFQDLARRRDERHDLVIVDPPAFVKLRKDLAQGLKGYRKLARLAAQCTAPGGLLFIASCSHHADGPSFLAAVAGGLSDAGRQGRLLKTSGAGPDHPVHPLVPETAYLKALTFALD